MPTTYSDTNEPAVAQQLIDFREQYLDPIRYEVKRLQRRVTALEAAAPDPLSVNEEDAIRALNTRLTAAAPVSFDEQDAASVAACQAAIATLETRARVLREHEGEVEALLAMVADRLGIPTD